MLCICLISDNIMKITRELPLKHRFLFKSLIYLFVLVCSGKVFGALNASATYKSTPAEITLKWNIQGNGVTVNIFRRTMGEEGVGSWIYQIAVAAPALSYVDNTVEKGVVYEYKLVNQSDTKSSAYIAAGIEVALAEERGTLLLVIDNTITSSLSSELLRFEQDLRGDGWKVIRHHSLRHGSGTPEELKEWIVRQYHADTINIKALLLFGHLPVCKSGFIAPDGHDNMPLPTDLFYADMDGTWTDNSTLTSSNPTYSNLPGDGKYDQNYLPGNSRVELQVGRVDLSGMTAFKANEIELLRNYLNKNHYWRQTITKTPMKAVAGNSYLGMETSAVHALFGSSNVTSGNFYNTNDNPYTWAVDFGDAVGANYANYNYKATFFINFGSHKQKFDQNNNQMRAILCLPEYGLSCAWGSRPFWFFHHMGMGETIGYSAFRTQNNRFSEYTPACSYWFQGGIWNNLMGDPTLRMHMVIPPKGLAATAINEGVRLSWKSSPDATEGYHVYRYLAENDSIERITDNPVMDTVFIDAGATSQNVSQYMVRVMKLDEVASGSYYNLSQGVFTASPLRSFVDSVAPTVPSRLRISQYGSTSITLDWDVCTDNVAVSGYEVFKNGTSIGTTDTTSFEITGLVAGTNYNLTVQAKDAVGNVSLLSDSLLTGLDTQAPSKPTNLTASSVTKSGFTLKWTASTDNVGVVAYDVYVDEEYYKSTVQSKPGSAPSTTMVIVASEIDWTTENTPFAVTVKAQDITGNVSQASEPLMGIVDSAPPTAPLNLRASDVTTTGFTLNWEASTDNVEVTGYYIYVNGVLSKTVSKSTSTGLTPTSYVFAGLNDSTTYTLIVRAKDSYNNLSPFSESLDVTTSVSGVNDLFITERLMIFPNPVVEKVNISIASPGSSEVLIFDVLGKEVISSRFNAEKDGQLIVSAAHITTGLYYMVVKSDKKTYVGKFMKK